MSRLNPYWRMTYAADRRKHRHRCRRCKRIVQPGDDVYMARVGKGKTQVLHADGCAGAIAVDGVTELALLECHAMKYLAGCGSSAAQKWLDDSPLTKTRPARDPVAASLDREDAYWRSVGGRTDGVTDAVGFSERYELMLRELP